MYPYVETAPLKFDLDKFNPEFFQHVERRLADLERLGIQQSVPSPIRMIRVCDPRFRVVIPSANVA